MTQREQMLSAVKRNKPESTPLPEMKLFNGQLSISVQDKFIEMLKKIGGTTIVLENDNQLGDTIRAKFPIAGVVASNLEEIDFANVNLNQISDPHLLENINLTILKGEFGVAENGAVWLTGESMLHHALPFITQHLILVINRVDIVENMHVAYSKLEIQRPGYGVFIAGPSKTADIEQSLVIGAHGSRSLLVIMK